MTTTQDATAVEPTPNCADTAWLTSTFDHIDDIVENRQDQLDPADAAELARFIASSNSARDAVMYDIIHVGDIGTVVSMAQTPAESDERERRSTTISGIINEYITNRNDASRHARVIRGVDWLDSLHDQTAELLSGDDSASTALVGIRSLQSWLLWSIDDTQRAQQAVDAVEQLMNTAQGVDDNAFTLARLIAFGLATGNKPQVV